MRLNMPSGKLATTSEPALIMHDKALCRGANVIGGGSCRALGAATIVLSPRGEPADISQAYPLLVSFDLLLSSARCFLDAQSIFSKKASTRGDSHTNSTRIEGPRGKVQLSGTVFGLGTSNIILFAVAAAMMLTQWALPACAQMAVRNQAALLVTRYGARCDGATDDTKAFQTALAAAGARCRASGAYVIAGFGTILVPDGVVCKLNGPLTNFKSDCVGISSYGGATLDFTGLARGRTALTLKPLAYGAYSGNVARFENIQMIGPGRKSNTVGIASATPSTTFRQYNIHGFGHGYEVRSGSWVNHFVNVSIADCGVDLYCGSGLKDAGEQISFDGGVLANSDQGIENDSCEFNITDSSLDEFDGPAVVNGGGSTRLTNDHIEYVNSSATTPLMVSSKACNAWGSITMDGGQIQFDHAPPKALAWNDGGPGPCGGGGWGSYISIRNVFLGNIPMNADGTPRVGGSNATQIAVCHATKGDGGGAMGNVRNIGRPNLPNQSQC